MRDDRRRRGFTLMELLIVIAIMAILAGLLVPVIFYVQKQAKISATKAEIGGLKTALAQYDFSFGQFPPDTSATAAGVIDAQLDKSSEILVYYLCTEFKMNPTRPHHVKASANAGPFYTVDHDKFVDTDGDGFRELPDPWGRLYEYDCLRDDATGYTPCTTDGPDPRQGVAKNPTHYDVFSRGPEGGPIVGNFK